MDNLLQSYKKILSSITPLCNNLPSYPQKRKPKLSNLELVCLSLASQYASIDSENHLFKILRGTFLEGKIERSVYNRRCRKLFAYKEAIRNKMSSQFPDIGGLFIIDAMPDPICKQIRANVLAYVLRQILNLLLDIVQAKKQLITVISFTPFVIKMGYFILLI